MKKIKKILVWLLIILAVVFAIPLGSPGRTPTPNYNIDDLKFPKDFFFGASTAAHQVEGGTNNQLTQWEKDNAPRLASEAEAALKGVVPNWNLIKNEATNPANYISDKADDEYNRYLEDTQLMKNIGINAYRFSIEWSRIEPQDGRFDSKELAHYATEIQALKDADIEPFVTLWHRSEPIWVMQQGDWENSKTIDDYKKFAEYVTKNLGADVKYWMTFNEPILNVVAGYVQGTIPPQVKSIKRAKVVLSNMIEAHKQAYQVIHSNDLDAVVGSTQAMQRGSGAPNTIANQLVAGYLTDYANWKFLDATRDQTDFVGIQYYGPTLFGLAFGGSSVVTVKNSENTKAQFRSDAGREIYPKGIFDLISESYKRYGKPIIITENGIADADDVLRGQYISDHLYWVKKAVDEGIPVNGYFYWSLLDNFEWTSGFWPRFGLIEVDYNINLKRTIRPSAQIYKQIIGNSAK
jgi:beta-glucosidase